MARKSFFLLLLLLLPLPSNAQPYYSLNLAYVLIGKEPPTARGYQVMLKYDPDCFKWRGFDLYFDGGFSHFWVTNTPYHRSLSIYSIAPVARYVFPNYYGLTPFFELSIGVSYLTRTYLDSRNLGIHFAFQDRIGIGTFIGSARKLAIGLHAVHYSNASLSEHNSGITMPLVFDVTYRFN